MLTLRGKHNEAVIYTDSLDDYVRGQIQAMCDAPFLAGCQIRIMPDVHAGKGATIGTTMTLTDKAVPNMVGVDIGCGMETVKLAERTLDFAKLDAVIRSRIPYGRDIHEADDVHPFSKNVDLTALACAEEVNIARAIRSTGSLGGGNHFIEIDEDEEGALYLVIHSGSRHLGVEVAHYYQEEGFRQLSGNSRSQIEALIQHLKAEGRSQDIQRAITELRKQKKTDIPEDMAYVEGDLFHRYLHDMKITQAFAAWNRRAMTDLILMGLGLHEADRFTTIHNYIDTDEMILRKGAVAAHKGEPLLIPINMRDGSLLCVGKGNPDWNQSAPHGAGRLMSRRQAFHELDMDSFKASMTGIYTTCVKPATLDEAPMAYKPIDEIISHIHPTAEIIKRLKPVYNFKADN